MVVIFRKALSGWGGGKSGREAPDNTATYKTKAYRGARWHGRLMFCHATSGTCAWNGAGAVVTSNGCLERRRLHKQRWQTKLKQKGPMRQVDYGTGKTNWCQWVGFCKVLGRRVKWPEGTKDGGREPCWGGRLSQRKQLEFEMHPGIGEQAATRCHLLFQTDEAEEMPKKVTLFWFICK